VDKEHAKSRLHHVRHILGGAKGSAMVAAGGAGSYFLAKFASEKVEFLRSQWYMLPAAMAVGGHFLKRKNAALGAGLLGAAGYAFGVNYDFSQAAKKAGAVPQKEAGALFPAGGGDASGFEDAGALMGQPLADAPDTLPQGPAPMGDAGWADEYDVSDAMNLAA